MSVLVVVTYKQKHVLERNGVAHVGTLPQLPDEKPVLGTGYLEAGPMSRKYRQVF